MSKIWDFFVKKYWRKKTEWKTPLWKKVMKASYADKIEWNVSRETIANECITAEKTRKEYRGTENEDQARDRFRGSL